MEKSFAWMAPFVCSLNKVTAFQDNTEPSVHDIRPQSSVTQGAAMDCPINSNGRDDPEVSRMPGRFPECSNKDPEDVIDCVLESLI